jgi:drug/metabolite transporter (DMT)-like permease
MGTQKLIGIVLLVVGLVLLYFGWQSTQSLSGEVTEAMTGRFDDETMMYLIGGAVATVLGLVMAIFKR